MGQRGLMGSTANALVPSQKQSAFTSRREQLESVSSTPLVFLGVEFTVASSVKSYEMEGPPKSILTTGNRADCSTQRAGNDAVT
ncbi:hypothetical protein TNCV_4263951 [Trichonephila clavipes]|nr:hypothetical protein TNCV_4263951 [Trichonephila clavipes]